MLRRVSVTAGLIVLWAIVVAAVVVAETHLRHPVPADGKLATIEKHFVKEIGEAAERRRLGSAAFVLIEKGEIVAAHGFGIANAETGSAVNPDRTLYQVASVSKAVTAWGVLKLVQDGKLTLDEPVIRHLRRWRFSGSDARREKVTIRHLLTHTAGLEGDLGYGLSPGEPVPPLTSLETTITREPGTTFGYSNASYAVLQLLVEDITQRPFAPYMKESVLDPLGMTSSSFDWEAIVAEGRGDDLATSYDRDLQPAPRRRYASTAPVALYTTPHDLARFARAFVKANPVLTPKTIARITAPQPATGGTWGLGHTLFAPNIVGHDGGTRPAWGAMLRVNPATGNGMVLMVSGGSGSVNQLGHDWQYWETGELTPAGRRQRLYDRALPASIAMLAGAIAIVVWQRSLGSRLTPSRAR